MRFWLGTHRPNWLERVDVPLFVSRNRLDKQHRLPRALGPWALDSGGYTALNHAGRWDITAEQYIEFVQRCAAEIGNLAWAAPMDWMCEPHVLANTGLSVRDHQDRTVANYLELRGRGPFVPVLQGQHLPDYERCVDLYDTAGVDLRAEPVIGLGTVCRRQNAPEIARIVTELANAGLRLHGFGMKSQGLARVAHLLVSADSMAWSTRGRMAWQHDRLTLCGHHEGSCANCMAWALRWRDHVTDGLGLFAEHERPAGMEGSSFKTDGPPRDVVRVGDDDARRD